MSFLGTEEYGEHDLVDDLALQQDATEQAVHMIDALERTSPPSPTAGPAGVTLSVTALHRSRRRLG
jgi:hypothetical protein